MRVASPPIWEARSLREVVTKLVDGSHNPPPKQDTGMPMLSARNIDRGQVLFDDYRLISENAFASENARTRIAPGDVLLTIVGTIGRTAVVPEGSPPFSLQRSVAVLTPSANLLPKFLCYQLESPAIQKHFEANARGTAQKGVYLKTLGQTPIVLPPVDVQREIVFELEKQFSRLDEAVVNLQRVKANLKRYKASVLKAAVEGRLVETEATLALREGRTYESGELLLQRILEERRAKWAGRGKFSEPEAPASTHPTSIPDGWCGSTVPQIATISSGNTPAGILDLVKPDGDLPWFKVGDMNHEENQHSMLHSDAWLTHQQVEELGLRTFPPQTVIFPKRGGAIATNKKRLLCSPGACDLNVMGITPFDEVAPYFFLWFESVDLGKLSDGSNIPQINNKDIVPLIVPLPPLAEQARIVAEVDRHLSIIREVEGEVDANLLRAQALRQTTLAQAFSND